MTKVRPTHLAETAKYGLLVGIAGGLAEIIWIAFYGSLTGSETTVVARTISTTIGWVLPGGSLIMGSLIFGIVIHMIAAVGLGLGLVSVWHVLTARRPGAVDEYTYMVIALVIIWVFNFFVVLPLISPAFLDLHRAFVEVVPYPVSLMSKLLFGLAGAAILRYGASDLPGSMPMQARAW